MKRKDFFELWIKALESGEYRQGKEYLLRNEKYCCLGVACDVAIKENARKVMEIEYEQVLPETMMYFLGIDDTGSFLTPITHRGVEYDSLAHLNDRGVKFKTIAKIIREQLAAGNFEKP